MAAESVFKQCLDAVATAIQNLNLTGLTDNRVAVRRLPHDGEAYFPGITVHPVSEVYHAGTNMREAIGYGCAVTIVVNNENDQDYLLDRLLQWREKIRRYFVENSTLPGVTATGASVCTLKVEHGNPLDWNDLTRKNYDVSTLIVRAFVWETRT
jgi:hypothetical protein